MCEIIEHERFKNKKYEKSCTYLMKRKMKNGKEMSDWTTEWNQLFIRHTFIEGFVRMVTKIKNTE